MNFENENIEFKSQVTNDLYKEVIAFANTDGGIFEEMRSMNQELTFEDAGRAFDRYKVEFSEEKYRALGITDTSELLYTNLAFILSDQCQHTTKVAVFADDSNTEFRDSKEFSGSVFRQLDETFSYLRLCNRTQASFDGLERIENPDYPEEAIRESLLNAIVHRDYSFSGSIIINVNDREMEFISLGGLLPGLSPDDIRSGISQPRNRKLAEVFHRLHLIEAYGTGIRRIYNLYRNCSTQPRIEITNNTFKIVLPNRNSFVTEEPDKIEALPLTAQKRRILEYIEDNGEITEAEIEEMLHVRRTRAYTIAKQMCDDGFIAVSGRGADKKYRVND